MLFVTVLCFHVSSHSLLTLSPHSTLLLSHLLLSHYHISYHAAVILGDGSPVNGEALLKVAEFQRDHRICFQWKKGDIIIIDNFVTMHSRNTFERPRRILCAIGGPSNDGYSIGSGIRAQESVVGEDIPLAPSGMGIQ